MATPTIENLTFHVTITEMITKTYAVQARTEEDAENIAQAKFDLNDDTPAEREIIVVSIIEQDKQPVNKPKL